MANDPERYSRLELRFTKDDWALIEDCWRTTRSGLTVNQWCARVLYQVAASALESHPDPTDQLIEEILIPLRIRFLGAEAEEPARP